MQILETALAPRLPLLTEPHDTAVRLFNGFTEGLPGLVAEVYARTLVLLNHAAPGELERVVAHALEFYWRRMPWLESGLVKTRRAADGEDRLGQVVFGERLARRVREDGLAYALDLRLNQDTSFYIDTRLLRGWLRANSAGMRVFNTFAYSGSLGAACVAGGAAQVLQSDLNRRFLNLGKDTYALNGWAVRRSDFLAEDFFRIAARLRRAGEFFDLVVLDPPFFSETQAGRVDLVGGWARWSTRCARWCATGGGWSWSTMRCTSPGRSCWASWSGWARAAGWRRRRSCPRRMTPPATLRRAWARRPPTPRPSTTPPRSR